ncbi:MAG TPA: lipoyl(octanoyl) transferase LipB [Ignavibacteriaceae bacterium]
MAKQYIFDVRCIMENKSLTFCDLGLIGYKEAWDLQYEILNRRTKNEIDDVLLLLEHPHTYTLGKTADKSNLISSEEMLHQKEISIFEIDRGGDVTYHGPGQIVGYPIIDLSSWQKDTHKYLRALEEVIIRTLDHFNISGTRNPKHTGVWIDDKKIAAIGIKVSRWVTMHGFAFNVNTDLTLFNGIIPCGIKDKEVTSLKSELNMTVDLAEVKSVLVNEFINTFNYETLDKVEDIRSEINFNQLVT